MKNNLLYLVFLFVQLSIQAQSVVQWSDSIVVTSTPSAITAPRVTLMPDGIPLVTWGTSGNPAQLWCSRFENGTFSTPVGIVQAPFIPALYGFGGYDVAVSDSQIFVVFEQLTLGILLARSDDGGLTFNPPVFVQGTMSGEYTTLSALTIDGTGNPIVGYILEKNGATYQVRRSTDGGLSFNEPVTGNAPAPGGLVCECCVADMEASGDSIWMVFRNNNQNLRDIWVSRSTDLAESFTTAADVDATDWILNACPISGPRMARSGDSLLMAWMSRASGIGRVYLSTLHAGTMQTGQQLGFPIVPLPQNAQSQADVTASGDTIGVVFVEKAKEIVGYFSTTGASDVPSINARFAIPNHTLQLPSIAFRNGIFHLVYVDATSDKVLYRTGWFTESSKTEEPKEAGVQIFPNPTEGIIRIVTKSEPLQELRITDVQGKNIHFQTNIEPLGYDISIDIDNFPMGVYFIHVKTNNGWMQQKIFKN